MLSSSLHSSGLSKVTRSASKSHTKGISVTYIKAARASPRALVLQHGIDAGRLQGGSVFGIRMDLEEVDWRLGSP